MQFQRVSRQIKHLPEPVRLRFPNLYEKQQVRLSPTQPPSGQFAFRAGLVIHQSQQQNIKLLTDLVNEIANETWIAKGLAVPQNFRHPLIWGPTNYPKDPNLTECYVVNAAAGQVSPERYQGAQDLEGQPEIKAFIAGPGTPLIDVVDQRMVFSGVECFVSLGLYSYQTTAVNGGVGAGLNAILLTGRDVGRFDSRMSASEAFDDVPSDAFASTAMAPPAGAVDPTTAFTPPGQAPAPQQQQQQFAPQQQAPQQFQQPPEQGPAFQGPVGAPPGQPQQFQPQQPQQPGQPQQFAPQGQPQQGVQQQQPEGQVPYPNPYQPQGQG